MVNIKLQFPDAVIMQNFIDNFGKGNGDLLECTAEFDNLTKFELQQAEDLYSAYEVLGFEDFEEEVA